MLNRLNLLGAVTAHVIFISSIITFAGRLVFNLQPGHWIGTPILLMIIPLSYLLLKAPAVQRPVLYYIQVSLMLIWLVILFSVDYVFKIEFRQTQWLVITFVMLYFAAMGGMIGLAAEAGWGWAISAVILFFIAAVLAFVQRAVTGI